MDCPLPHHAQLLSVQPGSALPRIKWNLLNAVLVADLARPSDRLAIRKTLELIKSEAPIRFGLVLKSTRQNALARSIFMHLEAVYGKKSCAEFVEKVGKRVQGDVISHLSPPTS